MKTKAKTAKKEKPVKIVEAPKPEAVKQAPQPKPEGKIFLYWHLGLGDAIVCNGLVRSLLDRYEKIMIPCRSRNLSSVRFMFRDESRIEICPVTDDFDMEIKARGWLGNGYNTLRVGIHRKEDKFDTSKWDQEFYRHAEVPFENRWKRFFVQRDTASEIRVTVPRYVFVYRDLARGFNLDMKRIPKSVHIVEATQVHQVFMWWGAIENAEEIHAIEGGILCLIDSLKCNAKVRLLHRYARNTQPPTLSPGWITT